MKSLLTIAIAIFMSGCMTMHQPDTLSEQESAVRLLRKSDPPANCKSVGSVRVESVLAFNFCQPEECEIRMKKKAAALGGNLVTIDDHTSTGVYLGTAYSCKAQKTAVAQ